MEHEEQNQEVEKKTRNAARNEAIHEALDLMYAAGISQTEELHREIFPADFLTGKNLSDEQKAELEAERHHKYLVRQRARYEKMTATEEGREKYRTESRARAQKRREKLAEEKAELERLRAKAAEEGQSA